MQRRVSFYFLAVACEISVVGSGLVGEEFAYLKPHEAGSRLGYLQRVSGSPKPQSRYATPRPASSLLCSVYIITIRMPGTSIAMSKPRFEMSLLKLDPDCDEPPALALAVAVAPAGLLALCPPESVAVAEVVAGEALPVASATWPHCDA